MRYENTLLTLCAAVALTSCGTRPAQPLSPHVLTAIKNQPIFVAAAKSQPNFTAFTPGKAAFGLIGSLGMTSVGNQIVAENAIANPAAIIATGLTQELRAAVGSKLAPAAAVVLEDASIAKVAGQAGGVGLALVVRTRDWGVFYYPGNFNRYRANIKMQAELIDAATRIVVAKAGCEEASPHSADVSPTYDEMMASGAQRLKQELVSAQTACVATLQQRLLGRMNTPN
jgi:hypothetical protein